MAEYIEFECYFLYNYFWFPQKLIKFLYCRNKAILIITKLLMCGLLIFNLKGCIDILFNKEFILVIEGAIRDLEIGFLVINTIFILIFLFSCRSTYNFFLEIFHRENYYYKFGSHSIRSNTYFKVKTILWYWQTFLVAGAILLLFVIDESKRESEPIVPNLPYFIFSTSWVIGAIYFLKGSISEYFDKFFFEFQKETTIQVDYLDFQNDKIIDKNPHIQEGQLLKIHVEPYPKNKENANLISILNTKTPNKEAVVFQFYDNVIADKIRNDDKSLEVSVVKVLPYYKLDLKLKRNFLFDDEKKIYDKRFLKNNS